MKKVVPYSQTLRLMLAAAVVGLFCGTSFPRASATLLSSFEDPNNLTSSTGAIWGLDVPASYTATGATEGVLAIQLERVASSWTSLMTLDGGPELADLFATHDEFKFDVTQTPGAWWHQVFVQIRGENEPGQQFGPTGSGTLSVDLVGTGLQSNAVGSSWWQIQVYAQGQDNGTGPHYTTLDNFRFEGEVIPEPATLALLSLGVVAGGFVRRRTA